MDEILISANRAISPYFSTLTWDANDEVRKEILPDGTEVTLNKYAEVAYTEGLW